MPKFPTKESDVVALAESMIAGYTAHPDDFPSVTAESLTALQAALNDYQNNKQSQVDAKAQSKIATETKDGQLDGLVELMKSDLKLSEVDVADDPEKLSEIGWGPRREPVPIDLPGQPENLHPIAEGPGNIWLSWDKPANGGTIRNYVIESRFQPAGGGNFTSWAVAGTSLNTEINLLDQTRGIQLEYRVKAVNIAGESLPSNTAAAVL